jgi:hypothetical protein
MKEACFLSNIVGYAIGWLAGWLNCFINGCWILVAACMVLASRRAPKEALIVSLSFSHDPSRRLIKGSLVFVKYCGLF